MPTKDHNPEQDLLLALRHPLRKWLLRLYVEVGEPLSPKELADYTKQHLSGVGYHVRQLANLGALELVETKTQRGAVQHFYKPTELVMETPWVLAVLGVPSGAAALAERRAFRKRLKERWEDPAHRRILELLGEDDHEAPGE